MGNHLSGPLLPRPTHPSPFGDFRFRFEDVFSSLLLSFPLRLSSPHHISCGANDILWHFVWSLGSGQGWASRFPFFYSTPSLFSYRKEPTFGDFFFYSTACLVSFLGGLIHFSVSFPVRLLSRRVRKVPFFTLPLGFIYSVRPCRLRRTYFVRFRGAVSGALLVPLL